MTSDLDVWAPFRLAVARWMTDQRACEDIPHAALEVLVAGGDTPSLRVLAGMDGASWSEVEPVAHRVLVETGRPMSMDDARVTVADHWLELVASGSFVPRWEWALMELFNEIGGAYHWFSSALNDLELIDAMEGEAGLVRAARVVGSEATKVLEMPVADRLVAPAPPPGFRPLFDDETGGPR